MESQTPSSSGETKRGETKTSNTKKDMLQKNIDWNVDNNATKVDLSHKNYTSKDLIIIVERLKNMPNLTELDLRGNQIVNVEPLQSLTNLTKLYLDGKPIQGNIPPSIQAILENDDGGSVYGDCRD